MAPANYQEGRLFNILTSSRRTEGHCESWDPGWGHMRTEKQIVKRYYDVFGWRKDASGTYNDTALWFDRSEVTASYQHQCLMRVNRFLKPSGTYLLNAGSGAIQHHEHLSYGSAYKRHVCVDISMLALAEARSKLGERGLFVLADVANLPFKDETFDSVIYSEVLFHVPGDEQHITVREFHRVLRYNAACVIIYVWPKCLLSTVTMKIKGLKRMISKIPTVRFLKERVNFRRSASVPAAYQVKAHPPLYYHAHDYQWFEQALPDHWNVTVRPFRSLDEDFMATLVPHNRVGKLFLKLIYWCEEVLPSVFARIGRYPMFVINKGPIAEFSVPRGILQFALALALGNLVLATFHAIAHMQLGIELALAQNLFVILVLMAAPLGAAVLLMKGHRRAGGGFLSASMVCALVFGLMNHFGVDGPDHIAQVALELPSAWGSTFRVTTFLLAAIDALGCYSGLRILKAQI